MVRQRVLPVWGRGSSPQPAAPLSLRWQWGGFGFGALTARLGLRRQGGRCPLCQPWPNLSLRWQGWGLRILIGRPVNLWPTKETSEGGRDVVGRERTCVGVQYVGRHKFFSLL